LAFKDEKSSCFDKIRVHFCQMQNAAPTTQKHSPIMRCTAVTVLLVALCAIRSGNADDNNNKSNNNNNNNGKGKDDDRRFTIGLWGDVPYDLGKQCLLALAIGAEFAISLLLHLRFEPTTSGTATSTDNHACQFGMDCLITHQLRLRSKTMYQCRSSQLA
jgi:hypothetical protein